MKFLCEKCNRLGDVERFRIEGGVLVVACPACNAESRAAPPLPVAPIAPLSTFSNVTPLYPPLPTAVPTAVDDTVFEVPAGHCPKCISRRLGEAPACPVCGLVFSQATDTFAPDEWLKGEWRQLHSSWADEARHESLRVEAMNRGQLAEIGRLYRLRLAAQPQDPLAVRGRDEVLKLAVMPQVQRQLKADPDVPKWKYIALSAVILGCLIALFLLVRQMLNLS